MNRYYKIFPHIKLVKGEGKAILFDLQKGSVHYITEEISKLLELCEEYTISEIKDIFRNQIELLDDNINYFKRNELLFETCEINSFKSIDMVYETPETIKNAVIEYTGNYSLKNLLEQLKDGLVKFLEVRISLEDKDSFKKAFEELKSFSEGPVKGIQVLIEYGHRKEFFGAIDMEEFPKLVRVMYCNSPYRLYQIKESVEYVFTKHTWEHIRHANNNYKSNFIFSRDFFIEAHTFNPYYNKRVCVDETGQIKNCLKNKKSFGNIYNDNLMQIISLKGFQKLWEANHDKIIEVKNHELRYNMFITNNLKQIDDDLYSIVE